MSDTVTTKVFYQDSEVYIASFTNTSDGTGYNLRYVYLALFICLNIVKAYFPDLILDFDSEILLPVWCMGATYYVSPTGDNSDGLTWAKAKNSITDGMGLLTAGGGDILCVLGKNNPIYRETATTTINAASDSRHTIYMDCTGSGTERSRLWANQAKVYGSINSGNAAYKWTPTASAANLFSNPGLETVTGTADDGTTDNFGNWAEEKSGDAYVDSTATVHGGSKAAKLYKGTGNVGLIYYNVPLAPSTSYTLSFWGKSDGTGTGTIYITYTYSATAYYLQDNLTWSTTSNLAIDGQGVNITATDTDYKRYAVTFTTPSANFGSPTQNVTFNWNSRVNNASIYLDDLSLALATPVTTTYYLEAAAGGDPSLVEPTGVVSDDLYSEDIVTGTVTKIAEGTSVAALTDHQWKWGDADALGYSTVYFRDDSGDPDVTGVTLEIPQRTNALQLDATYYDVHGGIYRFALRHGIEITSTNPGVGNRVYNSWSDYNNWHGWSANATESYCYGCVSVRNNTKGFQAHNATPEANPDLHVYLDNCTAYLNYYNYAVYSKMHLRNCISYAATTAEFFKQVADAENVIDPDEQNCIWYSTSTGDRNWKAQGEDTLPETHATSINADPLFRSATDYRLKAGSPAINAGTDVGLTTDFLGFPIIGTPDIGAYEHIPSGGSIYNSTDMTL